MITPLKPPAGFFKTFFTYEAHSYFNFLNYAFCKLLNGIPSEHLQHTQQRENT